MQDFAGRIAVVTGGGSGMGRELVRQLVAEGCHVSLCDLSDDAMEQTQTLALEGAPASDVRVTTHRCDVSDEASLLVFRDEVLAAHGTDHVNVLFNNAGIGGGGSLFDTPRAAWERTFDVCWGGVYLGTRTFLQALVAADEAHIVNTSSVNGFWASLGPDRSHTAYSAAKFAVKGFTEALITDLRIHAPHVRASVVMPGHVGTSIVENSFRHGAVEADPDAADLVELASTMFIENAPMSAADAAAVILAGVREQRWRILVGDDAHALDRAVRADPERAYEGSMSEILSAELGESQGAAAPD